METETETEIEGRDGERQTSRKTEREKGRRGKNERKPKQRGEKRRWKQANDPGRGGRPGSQELSHTNMSLIVITWEHLVCRCCRNGNAAPLPLI